MALTKHTFTAGDTITSSFLNSIQDAVIALQNEPRLYLYDEYSAGVQFPRDNTEVLASAPYDYMYPSGTPKIGDILVGLQGGYVATVIGLQSGVMQLRGTGTGFNL